MSAIQSILLAILQGATELFPISSLGHAVLVPALLGWGLDQAAPEFLPFLVLLHTGTAAALLLYFWRDWLGLLLGIFGGGDSRAARRLLVMIVIATIPAVILGYGLNHLLRALFANPIAAAIFLDIMNVFLFFLNLFGGRD